MGLRLSFLDKSIQLVPLNRHLNISLLISFPFDLLLGSFLLHKSLHLHLNGQVLRRFLHPLDPVFKQFLVRCAIDSAHFDGGYLGNLAVQSSQILPLKHLDSEIVALDLQFACLEVEFLFRAQLVVSDLLDVVLQNFLVVCLPKPEIIFELLAGQVGARLQVSSIDALLGEIVARRSDYVVF